MDSVNKAIVTLGGSEVKSWDITKADVEKINEIGLKIKLSIPVNVVEINGEAWVVKAQGGL